MAATEAAAATAVTSPTKSKAAEGARYAALAARGAASLQAKTHQSIEAAALQDLSLPCIPVSPIGYQVEEQKSASPNESAASPWYAGSDAPILLRCPSSVDDAGFEELVRAGLRNLSLNGGALTMEQAQTLKDLLVAGGCRVSVLNLARAIDPSRAPAISAALLEATMERLEAEFGPESEQENVEKVQQAVEKIKGEFTTYEAGVELLARKRLDRLKALFAGIGENRTLKELVLSKNNLGAPVNDGKSNFGPLRRLAAALDLNSSIERLNLSNNGFGPVGAGIVAKAMCKNISVHTLDLGGNDLVGEAGEEEEDPDQEEEDPVFGEMLQGLEALAEALKKNKFLKCLCLRGNRIKGEVDPEGEDDGLETPLGKLLEPLKKYHRLEILDLASNELGPGGAKMLANALENNRSVKVLDLSDNNIGPSGLSHITRLLKKNKALTTLVLPFNNLAGKKKGKKATKQTAAALTALGEAIAECTSLRQLDLGNNHLGMEFSVLALARLASTKIDTLRFESNDLCGSHPGEFDARGLQLIVDALNADGTSLRHLFVGGSFIQVPGIALLCSNASTLSALQTLGIARNGLGDEGFSILSNYLRENQPAISTLDLSSNGIIDFKPFAAVVRANSTVRHVNFANNALGRAPLENFAAVVDAIAERGNIHALDLQGNQLGDVHGPVLTSLCTTATAPLRAVFLRHNPNISLAQAQKIIFALKNNSCIHKFSLSSQAGDHTELVKTLAATLETNKALYDADISVPVDEADEALESCTRKLLINALAARE